MAPALSNEHVSPELVEIAEALAVRLDVGPVSTWALDVDGDLAELSDAPIAVVELRSREGGGDGSAFGRARRLLDESGLQIAWLGLVRNSDADFRCQTPAIVVANDCLEQCREALRAGPKGLLFDPALAGEQRKRRARICIAGYEVVGPTKNGGIGTANTSLAELLSGAGHEVTLVYSGAEELDPRECAHWERHYEDRGIAFVELNCEVSGSVETDYFNQARSYQLYRWLLAHDVEGPFDVIHFPDCQGHGYYTALARRLGLAFADSMIVIGAHSPTAWVHEANDWPIGYPSILVDDFLERRSVELADVLISPSAYMLGWMQGRGWQLPERSFVQPYVLQLDPEVQGGGNVPAEVGGSRVDLGAITLPDGPGTRAAIELGWGLGAPDTRSTADQDEEQDEHESPTELVFFGRLEPRKGLIAFCDALDILATDGIADDVRICFLGKELEIGGVPSLAYLQGRAERWPWPVRTETGLNKHEAVAYLRRPKRIAIVASSVDNSPNTVLEALGLGIPLIASEGGGTRELLHPEDVGEASFDPTSVERRLLPEGDGSSRLSVQGAVGLAAAIRRELAPDGGRRPRFAIDPAVNATAHLEWHERIAGAGAPPIETAPETELSVAACLESGDAHEGLARAAAAIDAQTAAPAQRIVAVSPELVAPAGLLSGLRDAGWRTVEGPEAFLAEADCEWLLLLEPATQARPELIATVTAAAALSEAEVVTVAAADPAEGDAATARDHMFSGHVPLGGVPLANLTQECLGVGCVLIARTTFEGLGGQRPLGGAPIRRADLLNRAILSGARFTVVPEPLIERDRDFDPSGHGDPRIADLAAASAYAEVLPEAVRDLPVLFRQAWRSPYAVTPPQDPAFAGAALAHIEAQNRHIERITSSASWRVTGPLRLLKASARTFAPAGLRKAVARLRRRTAPTSSWVPDASRLRISASLPIAATNATRPLRGSAVISSTEGADRRPRGRLGSSGRRSTASSTAASASSQIRSKTATSSSSSPEKLS